MDDLDTYLQRSGPVAKWAKKLLKLTEQLDELEEPERIDAINAAKLILHRVSPFKAEPVDCVIWVDSHNIQANDYNPNSVAPPEMKLLERSISEDGYTQPIVAWLNDGKFTVVDGFHRNRVGKESAEVRDRIKGYLPLTVINQERTERGDRIASTIRHNRARGKHAVAAMSEIVVELKRRNWTDDKIARELGMDKDEILRLCQISGLSELFSDQEFSRAWDVSGTVTPEDFKELTDDISTYGDETSDFRAANTNDENRIFHTHDKWECAKAGFYATTKEGMTRKQCETAMRNLLADIPQFERALNEVISTWKHSCEHYLTNAAMNRIAWLGQAATCCAIGVPAVYRGGFYLLSEDQQKAANEAALKALNQWLAANDRPHVTMDEAAPDREVDIY